MSQAASTRPAAPVHRYTPAWRDVSGRAAGHRLEGVKYLKMLTMLQARLKAERYLEIGTSTGDSIAVMRGRAVCIDPLFRVARDIWAQKEQVMFYQLPSDDYFARHDPKTVLGGPVQLAFIDGMHHYEYVLRDFMNVEAHCEPDAVIVLHDCVPWKFGMTHRLKTMEDGSFEPVVRAWTGDVWKVLPILREVRPDLHIALLDCPPTGLVAISNLNPASRVLRDRLDEIVARTDATPDTEERFWAWLEAQELVDTRKLVDDVPAFWSALALPPR